MRPAKEWVPDVAVAGVVLVLGLIQIGRNWYVSLTLASLLIVVLMAVAVGLSRTLPSVALGTVWAIAAVHVLTGTDVLPVEVVLAAVAFGCARWGSTATLWASALSIPAGALLAAWWINGDLLGSILRRADLEGLAGAANLGGDWRVTLAVVLLGTLATPWLLGLALRFSARATQSHASQVEAEAERDQAEEIARLREEQSQLARDVHDVVGHSLAVILAQAESAQYLPDADTTALRSTMENIATSARTSLDDVRQVLASTAQGPGHPAAPARPADLDSLIDGVRAAGHEVVTTEIGTPQPLPPELGVVAFRVLQEMLTNAIKHGRRGAPIEVERHWEGDLRIEVRNRLDDAPSVEETQPLHAVPTSPGGQGIDGMRRRLESVGGRLDVRRRLDPPTFTATAWVPMRVQA